MAQNVVEQLKNGFVKRGWLGVAIQDINKSLAESLDLAKPRGALINAVEQRAQQSVLELNPVM